MRKLNEMKVADVLLRGKITTHNSISHEDARLVAPGLSALAEIAAELGDAPYLFRDDVIQRVADIITAAAGMEDLYDDEEPGR